MIAGLSRFELVRRFRAQLGLTPHAFQTNLRIARAAVRAVPTAELDTVWGALRAPHRDAYAVLRGLSRHP